MFILMKTVQHYLPCQTAPVHSDKMRSPYPESIKGKVNAGNGLRCNSGD